MYPDDLLFETRLTDAVAAFRCDADSLGVVNDLDNWYVTEDWAGKFQEHRRQLLPLAENGNVLAQYSMAAIHMIGYCYSSESAFAAKWLSVEVVEATKWLLLAARQGHMCAVDNLGSIGVGIEADLVRATWAEVNAERQAGKVLALGETGMRLFGAGGVLNEKKAGC